MKKTISIYKSIWHQHLGPVKTKESERVMPLDDAMIADLLAWRSQTNYANIAIGSALRRRRSFRWSCLSRRARLTKYG